ncbi:hypothetical protein Goklo_025457 [Gossypium klotzschianum]|uniref:Uncharacterized protein n=1 Tax=Gossypium klotzschianum TaxID=34286 RepID=A0A7J8WDT5_9ROSI|nr:hypothetical protein [Gossypium klotzschianum]
MLCWLLVWSTCTMLEPITQIRDSKSHKVVSQFRHHNFPYYDQLTSIYTKDQATGKDPQTTVDIVEEIDADDATTANNLEEGNNYRGCEDDVSLDEMDVSAIQPQLPKPSQDDSISSRALPPRK